MIPAPVGQMEPWGWGLLVGWMCALPIVLFIIGILLCVWVYRDAESRGMNSVLWLIVVLITGIIGLIIYLIVRKPKRVAGVAEEEKPPPPPPP